ncbi:YfbU family protein [Stenotrophomonas forensis]|uniref:YfbU family protein n=1 Tax=Stenotrophomonas forensis TaxID=2871169 RepID=UPI0039C6EFB0
MKFTDEQRLIVMMLADIQKALNVRGDLDADFISKAAAWKNEFSIGWHHGSYFDDTDTPPDFRFVLDVLDMFSFLEPANDSLTPSERQDLDSRVGWNTAGPLFTGFDGNNESELRSYVVVAIDDLGFYPELKRGKFDSFNSHSQREDRYRAMLNVFKPIRAQLLDRKLTIDELAAVISAR